MLIIITTVYTIHILVYTNTVMHVWIYFTYSYSAHLAQTEHQALMYEPEAAIHTAKRIDEIME